MRRIWSLQRSKQTNDGLTLTELLVTLAVLAIIAALAFPILMDITNSSRNSALDRQREVVADFIDHYGSGSFANADGTGPDAGYRVGFPDYDNDGIQDANEPTVAKIGLDEYDEYILWQEGLNAPVGDLMLDYAPGAAGVSLLPILAGAAGDVTYSVESGTLPEGATLNPTTGEINAPYALTTVPGSVAVPVEAEQIVRLNDDSLMVSGEFTGTATFPGLPTLQAPSTRSVAYIAQLNADNTWERAFLIPGQGSNITEMELSGTGNLIVSGYLRGPVTIAGTTFNSTSQSFVGSVSTSGVWQWASIVGTDIDAMAATSDGGALIGGVLFDPNLYPSETSSITLGSTTLSSTGRHTAFMAKVSSTGAWQWARQGAGVDSSLVDQIAVNGSTAYFAMDVRGNARITGTNIDPNVPETDYQEYGQLAIARVNVTSGAILGITRASAVGDTGWRAPLTLYDLAVTADGGALMVVNGWGTAIAFGGTTVSTEGDFLAKMSSTGTWQWAIPMPTNAFVDIRGLTPVSDGSIRITALIEADMFTAGGSSVMAAQWGIVTAHLSASGQWLDVDMVAEGPDLIGYDAAATSAGFIVAGSSYDSYQLADRAVASPAGVTTGWIARIRTDGVTAPVTTTATVTIRATDASGRTISKTVSIGF